MTGRLYGPLIINLDSRTDRLSQIDAEFKKLTMTYIRISASTGNPVNACIDSHCRCLEEFLQNKENAVLICEDDAKFNIDKENLDIHINEFLNSEADVLCLGYYASNPIIWSQLFNRSKDIQTRVAYIVKRQVAKELLDIWRRLYTFLIQNPKPEINADNWYSKLYNNLPIKNKASDIYRGDQAWKLLQQKYYFLIPKSHIVVQRPSYSDIEKRFVDYKV